MITVVPSCLFMDPVGIKVVWHAAELLGDADVLRFVSICAHMVKHIYNAGIVEMAKFFSQVFGFLALIACAVIVLAMHFYQTVLGHH